MPRKKNSPTAYPMIPLRGLMVFPRMILHFDVGRAPSVAALEKAMLKNQQLVLMVQRDEEKEEPVFEDLWPVGMIAVIKQVISLPGDALRVLVNPKPRAHLHLEEAPPPLSEMPDTTGDEIPAEALKFATFLKLEAPKKKSHPSRGNIH